jgi:L-alanine-DL-glutamate epimerase-like enolase superfamily enzyme
MLTIFFAALAVLFGLGFFATLVAASQQADDLLRRIDYRDARIEDLENELRHHQRGRHPAGRGMAAVSEKAWLDNALWDAATVRADNVRYLPKPGDSA